MTAVDTDRSGKITREEWVKHYVANSGPASAAMLKQLQQLFHAIDQDGSGTIRQGELEEMLRGVFSNSASMCAPAVAAAMASDLARELMERMDRSKDGNVDWDEFRANAKLFQGLIRQFRQSVGKKGRPASEGSALASSSAAAASMLLK